MYVYARSRCSLCAPLKWVFALDLSIVLRGHRHGISSPLLHAHWADP